MQSADFGAILPLLVLGTASLAVIAAIAAKRNHLFTASLTVLALAASLASVPAAWALAPRQVTELIIVDRYALIFTGLLLLASVAVALISYRYLRDRDVQPEEFYILLLVAVAGSVVLVCSSHFVSFFLGLEMLSVSLYAMNAYLRTRRLSLEAGIKYLVLAASSTAFLLFGMALVYSSAGGMYFPGMTALFTNAARVQPLVAAGLALIVTGFGFKLGLVPFHLWTPDVYEGAPAPVTAFVATVSKGAMFALLLRYFYTTHAIGIAGVWWALAVVAVASMIVGNLLALLQENVKRILAYSSIAHMGYVLVALLAGGELAPQAVMFYLAAYFVTTLGALAVITVLSDRQRDADHLADYRGLFWRQPVLAGVMTAMMLSLAGIPLTAGFVGKFYVVAAGAFTAAWALVVVLVVSSVIGLYYYLRVVAALYQTGRREPSRKRLSLAEGLVLASLTALLVWMGTFPSPFLALFGGGPR